MKAVKLQLKSGSGDIYVNPEHVMAIEDQESLGYCDVILRDGVRKEVRGKATEVAAKVFPE